MSEITLQTCPFCGMELRRNMRMNYEHENEDCILNGFEFTEDEVDDWNTRKPMDKIKERMEEEREIAHADFTKYVNEYSPCLDDEYDDIFHRGLERAIRIVKDGGSDA